MKLDDVVGFAHIFWVDTHMLDLPLTQDVFVANEGYWIQGVCRLHPGGFRDDCIQFLGR